MIKCPKCRHHISSMARLCPECGCRIDPQWAQEEAERELKKLEEVPFTVSAGVDEESLPPSQGEESDFHQENGVPQENFMQEDGGIKASQPEVTVAPPPLSEAKRGGSSPRGSWWKWVLAVVVMGLLIGGFYYYEYCVERQREQLAYEMLQNCSNPDFFEDFIIRYPKSSYIDEVRERYKQVVAQQQEWQRLIADGTRDDLYRFVREHPTSPYVKVALCRVDSLDWAEAKSRRTLEAVAQYVVAHPDGYYIDHAEQLRQTLERQRAEALAAQRDSLTADSAQTTAQPTT